MNKMKSSYKIFLASALLSVVMIFSSWARTIMTDARVSGELKFVGKGPVATFTGSTTTNGIFTNLPALYTNLYQVAPTNLLGRFPSTNLTFIFDGHDTLSNAVKVTWAKKNGASGYVIARSFDAGATYTNWAQIAAVSNTYVDLGTNIWLQTAYTSEIPLLPDPVANFNGFSITNLGTNSIVLSDGSTFSWNGGRVQMNGSNLALVSELGGGGGATNVLLRELVEDPAFGTFIMGVTNLGPIADTNIYSNVTAAIMRTNLGVVVGVDVMAFTTNLNQLATNNGLLLTSVNADLLDGFDSSAFAQIDGSTIWTADWNAGNNSLTNLSTNSISFNDGSRLMVDGDVVIYISGDQATTNILSSQSFAEGLTNGFVTQTITNGLVDISTNLAIVDMVVLMDIFTNQVFIDATNASILASGGGGGTNTFNVTFQSNDSANGFFDFSHMLDSTNVLIHVLSDFGRGVDADDEILTNANVATLDLTSFYSQMTGTWFAIFSIGGTGVSEAQGGGTGSDTLHFGGILDAAAKIANVSGESSLGTASTFSSQTEAIIMRDGNIETYSWNSASADATTIVKIFTNGVLAATRTLTGVSGVDTGVSIAVVAGDKVAFECDAGTAMGASIIAILVEL